MYKIDKSKKVILGTELNELNDESSSSENEFSIDDSDVEFNVQPHSKTEEIKGNFVFICKKKRNSNKNKLIPEVYIDENN